MVRLHIRPLFIKASTGLPTRSIAALYRHYHGGCHHAGPRLRRVDRRLRADCYHRQAVLLVSLWQAWGHGGREKRPEVAILVQVYEHYQRLAPLGDRLSFEAAWEIICELFTGALQIALCKACGGPFLHGGERPVCAWCRTTTVSHSERPHRCQSLPITYPRVTPTAIEGLTHPRQYQPFLQAMSLLQLGTRGSIVMALTGLSRHVARALARSLCGRGGTPGPLPQGAASFLRPPLHHRQATLWASLLLLQTGTRSSEHILQPDHFLKAYKWYLRLNDSARCLNINQAWVVARDLRSGAMALAGCHRCQTVRLTPTKPPGGPAPCPFCPRKGVR